MFTRPVKKGPILRFQTCVLTKRPTIKIYQSMSHACSTIKFIVAFPYLQLFSSKIQIKMHWTPRKKTQHNDTQPNDKQHNDTQHNGEQHIELEA